MVGEREKKVLLDIWTFRKPKHINVKTRVSQISGRGRKHRYNQPQPSVTFSWVVIKLIPANTEAGSLQSQPGHHMRQIAAAPGRTHVWKTGTGGGELKPFGKKGLWESDGTRPSWLIEHWIQRQNWPTQQSHFYDLFVKAVEIAEGGRSELRWARQDTRPSLTTTTQQWRHRLKKPQNITHKADRESKPARRDGGAERSNQRDGWRCKTRRTARGTSKRDRKGHSKSQSKREPAGDVGSKDKVKRCTELGLFTFHVVSCGTKQAANDHRWTPSRSQSSIICRKIRKSEGTAGGPTPCSHRSL